MELLGKHGGEGVFISQHPSKLRKRFFFSKFLHVENFVVLLLNYAMYGMEIVSCMLHRLGPIGTNQMAFGLAMLGYIGVVSISQMLRD